MDIVSKWFLCDNRVMLTIAKTDAIVNKAIKIHGLTVTTAAVLGRMLTMGTLMGVKLKSETNNITAVIEGDGDVGKVMFVAKNDGKIKGYIQNPAVDLMPKSNKKIDVGGAVGKGKLRVIMDVGMGAPYVGETSLVSGEIAEDFAKYYATSLQQPCAIALGVLMSPKNKCLSAGGILIEMMPDATEQDIVMMEEITQKLSDFSKILKELSPDEVVDRFFGKANPTKYEELNPEYKCNCSTMKMKKTLQSLKMDDIDDLFNKQEEVEVCCHFCGKKHKFKKEDIIKKKA